MGAATFFFCAIFSATAFGGRPGPPGRHFPRALRRRRRRPFVDCLRVETLPSNDWMKFPTSSCTNSRMTVSKLPCLAIVPPSVVGILDGERSSKDQETATPHPLSPLPPPLRLQRKRSRLHPSLGRALVRAGHLRLLEAGRSPPRGRQP